MNKQTQLNITFSFRYITIVWSMQSIESHWAPCQCVTLQYMKNEHAMDTALYVVCIYSHWSMVDCSRTEATLDKGSYRQLWLPLHPRNHIMQTTGACKACQELHHWGLQNSRPLDYRTMDYRTIDYRTIDYRTIEYRLSMDLVQKERRSERKKERKER